MSIFLNHKYQAFYVTSFVFSLLFVGFLLSASWLKISPQQAQRDSFSLAMQQFIAQASLQQPSVQELTPPTIPPKPKEVPRKKQPKQPTTQQAPQPQPQITEPQNLSEAQPIPSEVQNLSEAEPIPSEAQNLSEAQPIPSEAQNLSEAEPIPSETFETLTFGKDDHPFLRAVKQAIDSNVNYPRQARRMRIQGEVVVEFLWTKHNVLKDLKVFKSSGYSILDESALKSIQKAALHFPTHEKDAYLQIPIVFVLRG